MLDVCCDNVSCRGEFEEYVVRDLNTTPADLSAVSFSFSAMVSSNSEAKYGQWQRSNGSIIKRASVIVATRTGCLRAHSSIQGAGFKDLERGHRSTSTSSPATKARGRKRPAHASFCFVSCAGKSLRRLTEAFFILDSAIYDLRLAGESAI